MWTLTFQRQRRKEQAFAFLGGAKCKECGNTDPRVLEFHHVVERRKNQQTIAALLSGSWERLVKQLVKCEILCANCHKIKTFQEKKHIGV